ncbi:MAG: UDP-glucose/GDP-mannose dehydrogenase family protein [Proteobacteria bacterium]|nr:UDP-glucose/GDP-mannose dehydrogenase family protein [Pseudomonadota bacterium]
MRICVIGTGYVGLVTGTCFADFGVDVTCVDNDKAKIDALNNGKIPIYEPGLEELVSANEAEGRLKFTTDLNESIRNAEIIFIAVGTPPNDDGTTDLSYVEEVAKGIAENLNGYKVIVTKSTVPVGTGKLIKKIIDEKQADGHDFDIVSNPEFLREGSAIEDFMRPDRVVIGGTSQKAIEMVKELYSPLYIMETPFVTTDVETSELIKYASNAFLATKITFINEMANICEKVGADIHKVAKGMGLDKRIGSKFLHAGPGYGGSCFPKDTLSLASIGAEYGSRFRIVEAVIDVNESRIGDMVKKIKGAVGELEGKEIGVLGLAFKPKTDDIRDSPALKIVLKLIEQGARIRVYDPEGMENAKSELPSGVSFCADSYEAIDGADALLILTEWNQFRKLDFDRVKELLKSPVVIDLRNIYKHKQMAAMGFDYTSVGR